MTGVAFNSVKLGVPLVVDLDETLIKSDLLIEAVFKVAGTGPSSVFSLFSAWLRGKAHFKDVVAHAGHLDPVSLPYDEAVHRTLYPTVGPAVPNPKTDPLTLDLDQQTQAPQTSKDRNSTRIIRSGRPNDRSIFARQN